MKSIFILLLLISDCYTLKKPHLNKYIIKGEYIVKLRDSVVPHEFIEQNINAFIRDGHFKILNGFAFNGFAIRLSHNSQVEQLKQLHEVCI